MGTVTSAPAASTTLRTGVHLLPMIIGLVTIFWAKVFRLRVPPPNQTRTAIL
ncbi:hypothetical protein [Shinella sp.]|uniref:hypothetical protein n=1 Tax=Shinella sp. TaxID=1870904 RepID=UPI003F71755A